MFLRIDMKEKEEEEKVEIKQNTQKISAVLHFLGQYSQT